MRISALVLLQARGIAPEAFEVIIFAFFAAEDVENNIEVVHDHPSALGIARPKTAGCAVLLLQRPLQVGRKSPELRRAAARPPEAPPIRARKRTPRADAPPAAPRRRARNGAPRAHRSGCRRQCFSRGPLRLLGGFVRCFARENASTGRSKRQMGIAWRGGQRSRDAELGAAMPQETRICSSAVSLTERRTIWRSAAT